MLDLVRPPFEGADVDGYEILLGFCLGGAALALWLLIRFPSIGPRRPATMIAALLAVGLTLAFWVSGCLLRALADLSRLLR